jgi:competence ComEA-like helix-hairpin-helix protein
MGLNMRKPPTFRSLAALILVSFLSSCAQRSHDQTVFHAASANERQSTASSAHSLASDQEHAPTININTASAKQIEALPGIGKALAERIVEHREKYGPFRRAEHLIVVRGISDRRFRALRDLVTVE